MNNVAKKKDKTEEIQVTVQIIHISKRNNRNATTQPYQTTENSSTVNTKNN
jgi:hypothetical protein